MSKKLKKHTFEDRLKYMKMLEAGYSIHYISKAFGINHILLKSLWLRYNEEGVSALIKKKYTKTDGAFREVVVRDLEENHLSLCEASIKYDVSSDILTQWLRKTRENGYAALYHYKRKGRPPKDMGRPKKKTVEQMTDLERLQKENQELKTELALLKKVKALVEERNARLYEIGHRPSKD
jgi:transposase-like protein